MTIVQFGKPPSAPRVLRTGFNCPCGCGAGRGYRPLFVKDANGKDTITYRQDKESGEPLARIVMLCKADQKGIDADEDYRAARARWKHDHDMEKANAKP